MGSRKAAVLYGLALWAYIGETAVVTGASMAGWFTGSLGSGPHVWMLAASQALQVILVGGVIALGYWHVRGVLRVPETRVARLGFALVVVGVATWTVKVAALALFHRSGATILAFIAYSPLNLATMFILAGAGLVELSRIRSTAGARETETGADPPTRLAGRPSAPPPARVRRGTGVDWNR